LLLGAVLATLLSAIGSNDLENYEHSFFSLDRGTRTESVKLFGQPLYTLSLGLGVRLPLHGSLGGSPAAMVSPLAPEPVTYWLMFAIAIAAAAVVLRYALDPVCGPRISTVGALLIFCSVPMVNYALIDDWPETALTYCAFVVCTFAPHALGSIAMAPASAFRRRVAGAAVLALTFSAVATSHAGYWPFLAITLVCSAALSLFRTELRWPTKLMLVVLLGAASAAAVTLVAPDVLGEMQLAATSGERVMRSSQGPEGGGLLDANVLALGRITSRSPFTFLLLAVVALLLAPGPDHRGLRRVIAASALASVLLGLGATQLDGRTSDFAPSAVWSLRDPALTFALLSGALAFAVRQSSYVTRLTGVTVVSVMLLGAALVGPAVAWRVLSDERGATRIADGELAPRGSTPAQTRLAERGVPTGTLPQRSRIAFWPNVGLSMRNVNDAQADFPDGGFLLVTATTKQRTMAMVAVPNEALFDQSTQLSAAVLCDPSAIDFLQLKYLLAPAPVSCGPWRALPDEPIDGRLIGHIADRTDMRVRALTEKGISEQVRRAPAFGADAAVVLALRPVPDTRLIVRPTEVEISLPRAALAERLTLVLPVAYDSALRASSGTVEKISGLAAVVRPEAERVVLTFVPDARAISRAVAMMLSQVAACLGLIAIVAVRSTAHPSVVDPLWKRYLVQGLRWVVGGLRWTFRRRHWPHAIFAATAALTMNWVALLVPFLAVLISRARPALKVAIAGALFVGAAVRGIAGGSLSPEAIRDPLFWSLVAAIAAVGMMATRRHAAVSRVFAVALGATAAVAALLPMLPDFWTALSAPPLQLARQSFDALSSLLGRAGVITLLVLCAHGIVAGAWPATRLSLPAVMARAGLVVALAFAYAGGVSASPLDATSFIVLGILLGVAARATPDAREEAILAAKHREGGDDGR
jgi:hypothetical protein